MFSSACGSVCVAFSRYDWMSKRAPLCQSHIFIINAGALSDIFPRFALGAYIFSNLIGLWDYLHLSASYLFKIFFHFWLAPIPCLILHNQLRNHSPWNLKASSGRHGPHQRGLGRQEAVKKVSIYLCSVGCGFAANKLPPVSKKYKAFYEDLLS